jgi:hypothetical protein
MFINSNIPDRHFNVSYHQLEAQPTCRAKNIKKIVEVSTCITKLDYEIPTTG